MNTKNGNHATTQTPSWAAVLQGAAGLEEVKRELEELRERQLYLETIQAILSIAPFPLDVLRAAPNAGRGVVVIDDLPMYHLRRGWDFPDAERQDIIHQEGLYILYSPDGTPGTYSHGHQVNSLLDIANWYKGKHAGAPAVEIPEEDAGEIPFA